MNRSKLLAQKRTLLIAECALQRITLVGQIKSLGHIASWTQASGSLINRLKDLPKWLSMPLVGLMLFTPRHTISLARTGLMLWRLLRSFSSKL
ncbi:MAG: hypothetical protein K0R08_142 [Solimicrobium sp.]|nr:hypothetical protein [Solimicrobium sp.]